MGRKLIVCNVGVDSDAFGLVGGILRAGFGDTLVVEMVGVHVLPFIIPTNSVGICFIGRDYQDLFTIREKVGKRFGTPYGICQGSLPEVLAHLPNFMVWSMDRTIIREIAAEIKGDIYGKEEEVKQEERKGTKNNCARCGTTNTQ